MTLQVAPTQNASLPPLRQSSWPGDKPLPEDADSRLLIIRVDALPEYQPESPYCSALQYRLPPMTREAAEMLAAKLNRSDLQAKATPFLLHRLTNASQRTVTFHTFTFQVSLPNVQRLCGMHQLGKMALGDITHKTSLPSMKLGRLSALQARIAYQIAGVNELAIWFPRAEQPTGRTTDQAGSETHLVSQ